MVDMYSVKLKKMIKIPKASLKTKTLTVNGTKRYLLMGSYTVGKNKYKCTKFINEKDYIKYK
jgi:hypothetical protein